MAHTRLFRIVPLATLIIFASACGGGDDEKGSQPAPSATLEAGFDANAAMSQSAVTLANVDSAAATFEWHIDRDGFDIQGNGTYAAKSAEGFQLETHYKGSGDKPQKFKEANDSELLVLTDRVYLKTPPLGDGWVVFTPSELGLDWDATQRLLQRRSPFDYGTVLAGGTAEAVGVSRIDDEDFAQVRTVVDANVLVSALADAYGSQGQVMLANRFSGSVALNIWIDPTTNLPRRAEVDAEIDVLGEPGRLRLLVDYGDYGNVVLDEEPADATPFTELTS